MPTSSFIRVAPNMSTAPADCTRVMGSARKRLDSKMAEMGSI